MRRRSGFLTIAVALALLAPAGARAAQSENAHYFTKRSDGITANAFYAQGVRFLDTSDPTDIRQVG